jgi:hypothetical protein
MTEFTSKLTKEDWIGFNRIYGKYTFKKFFWVSMIILFLIILKQVYSLIRYVWLIQAYLGILDSHILVYDYYSNRCLFFQNSFSG